MKKIDLGQMIAILANIGVIAGIVFLGFELRQNSAAAELQAAQAYVNISHESDFRLAENPELVEVLQSSVDGRSPVDGLRVDRWWFGVLRTWENGFFLNKRGALDDELWSGQVAFMNNLLRVNGELREYRQDNREYFSRDFGMFLDDLLAPESE